VFWKLYFIEYSVHFFSIKMMLKYSLCSIHGRLQRKGLRWLLWWINLQWLNLVKLFLNFFCQKSLWNSVAHYTCIRIILNKIRYAPWFIGCEWIKTRFSLNLEWIQSKILDHGSNDPYWHLINLAYKQIAGIRMGVLMKESELGLPKGTFWYEQNDIQENGNKQNAFQQNCNWQNAPQLNNFLNRTA